VRRGRERERENGCQATVRGATSSIDRYPATSSGAGCVGGGGRTPLARWLYYPPSRTRRCRCSKLVLAVGNDAGVSATCTQACARARISRVRRVASALPPQLLRLIREEESTWRRFQRHNGLLIEGEIRSSHGTLPRKNSNCHPLGEQNRVARTTGNVCRKKCIFAPAKQPESDKRQTAARPARYRFCIIESSRCSRSLTNVVRARTCTTSFPFEFSRSCRRRRIPYLS